MLKLIHTYKIYHIYSHLADKCKSPSTTGSRETTPRTSKSKTASVKKKKLSEGKTAVEWYLPVC